MSILKNNKVIAVGDVNTNTYRPPILSCMWSDHIINDIQWLRADTFSWQSGDVYKTVYDKLVEEWYEWWEAHTVSDLENEGSVPFCRTKSGYKITSQDHEQAILNKYNTDGIAWYYILDTTNKRFKLPRTKWGFEGLRDTVGSDIIESLPSHKHTRGDMNITGMLGGYQGYSDAVSPTGAFYQVRDGEWGNMSSGYGRAREYFDASRNWTGSTSNPDNASYQDNAPVQERATQMYLYFYVGEFAQTAIEQTAGLNSEMFNGKVDVSSLYEINPMIISYVNGTSGYNIWANGYCEQWGSTYAPSTWVTINFLKTFKNTKYTVTASQAQETTSGSWANSSNIIRKCAGDYMQVSIYSATNTMDWKASGYLADGQY